jgi:hypothetical protein
MIIISLIAFFSAIFIIFYNIKKPLKDYVKDRENYYSSFLKSSNITLEINNQKLLKTQEQLEHQKENYQNQLLNFQEIDKMYEEKIKSQEKEMEKIFDNQLKQKSLESKKKILIELMNKDIENFLKTHKPNKEILKTDVNNFFKKNPNGDSN